MINGWTIIALLIAGACLGVSLGWWLCWMRGPHRRNEREQCEFFYNVLKLILENARAHETSLQRVDRHVASLPLEDARAVFTMLQQEVSGMREGNRRVLEHVGHAVRRCREQSEKLGHALPVVDANDSEKEQARAGGSQLKEKPAASAKAASAQDKLIEPSRRESATRRREERHDYRKEERVAFYDIGHLPSKEQFLPVQCVDLSTVGISFLWEGRPPSMCLVINLTASGIARYMKARVVHLNEAENRRGRVTYRVGCEFTERLDNSLFDPEA